MGGLLAAGGWIWRYICTFCEALLLRGCGSISIRSSIPHFARKGLWDPMILFFDFSFFDDFLCC